MGTEGAMDNKEQNEDQGNNSEDQTEWLNNQGEKVKQLELQLKHCEESLELNNEKMLVNKEQKAEVDKELLTQAILLNINYEPDHDPGIIGHKLVTKKLENILKENEELKTKIDLLCEELERLENNSGLVIPNTEDEIKDMSKALSASKLLLKQKCFEMCKVEEMNNELNMRLELEHDRRVRAQTEVGEIEKERMILQNTLDSKSDECVRRSEDYKEVKLGCDYKISKYTGEIKKLESKLEKVTLEKDKKVSDLHSENIDLHLKLDTLEEHYNNQLEVSKTLQKELQSSYAETQSLIKEMEMLNLMFAEVEHHIVFNETLDHNNENKIEVTQNDKKINVDEVLQVAQSSDNAPSLFQKSCFNEVTTKNGTKMVLSVSKTFLKLKDLILEKNSLEEQMTKMKHINETLCSQVNLHEEKLCGITDELNNTWFYVSKIKEQHKKLHSSEQILRAELAEKRQLLKNIRRELEESRTSWDLVKQKNAESEQHVIQLKADIAERKRLLMSSSESGFSELEEDKTIDSDTDSIIGAIISQDNNNDENSTTSENIGEKPTSLVQELFVVDDDDDDDTDSLEIPDPFSDDENEETVENVFQPMVTSVRSIIKEKDDQKVEQEKEKEPGFTPIFVPSMSYLAQVPSSLQPDLLVPEKETTELNNENMNRDRIDEDALDEVDDNVRDLINRLSSSTARGAFLANRLADIHRRIATGTSLTDHNDWFDNDEEEDEEETETDIDVDLKDEDDDDELTVPSPELNLENRYITGTSTPDSEIDIESEDSRPSSADSMILAIDEAINILDPVSSGNIPLAPPQPTYSLLPPSIGISVRPNFNQDVNNDFDDVDNDENNDDISENNQAPVQSSDSSTAVTRYLIKHLPKQLTQLRNEKHELEDKIHDFEQIVSEQRMQMAEHERRVEIERSKTKKLEERLAEIEVKDVNTDPQTIEVPVIFKVPVEVEQENMILSWTVESKSERPCGYWVSFVTAGATDGDSVILPNTVQEVVPMDVGITTTLQVFCGFKGKYTLHIQGCGTKLPQVTMALSPADQ